MDGSAESHDVDRPYHNGKGSYADVVDSLKVLARNNVPFGVLTVMNPKLNDRDVFEHHYALGIRTMDFTLPILNYDSFEAIYGQGAVAKFARFMCELFDAWVKKNDPAVSINSLENLSRMIAVGASRHCNTTNRCDCYITVEPNGDVGICENARVIENTDNHPVDYYLTKTNIATHLFDEIEQAVAHNFSVHEYKRRGELACPVPSKISAGTGRVQMQCEAAKAMYFNALPMGQRRGHVG